MTPGALTAAPDYKSTLSHQFMTMTKYATENDFRTLDNVPHIFLHSSKSVADCSGMIYSIISVAYKLLMF